MEPIQRIECELCDADHLPSAFAEGLEDTPSGADLFGHFECEYCGGSYVVSFRKDAYFAMFFAEMAWRREVEMEREAKEHQRWRSQVGRDVADFRRQLEAVSTVEDMPWTA